MESDVQHQQHIEVRICFLRPEEGGRKGPVMTGYRPQFSYKGKDCDASHTYPDVEWVYPGDTVRAFLSFRYPDAHHEQVESGMPFEVREGSRVVARGVVTKILNL